MSPKHGYSATIEIPKLQEPVVDRGWRLCHVGFFSYGLRNWIEDDDDER